MILVIGGLASGKRTFVKEKFGFSDADMADGTLNESPVLFNLQNLVAKNLDEYDALLPQLLKKDIIICNETGSGVVPIDKAERAAREATGRVCVTLAEKAEAVIRLCCGIPVMLKGEV